MKKNWVKRISAMWLALLMALSMMPSVAEAAIDVEMVEVISESVDLPVISEELDLTAPDLRTGLEDMPQEAAVSPEERKTVVVQDASPKSAVPASAKIVKGVPTQLKLGVKESYALNKSKLGKKLTFKSSNAKVATVDKKGVIKAKKKGSTTITCYSNKKKVATCKVTVKNAPSKVKLNKKTLNIVEGTTFQLKASIPKNTFTSKYTWTSNNKSIATVDNTGLVTANRAGTASITVKTANGKKATCKVTVKKTSFKIMDGKTDVLKDGYYVLPSNFGKGDSATLVITANVGWKMTTDMTNADGWLKVTPSKGKSGKTSIRLSVANDPASYIGEDNCFYTVYTFELVNGYDFALTIYLFPEEGPAEPTGITLDEYEQRLPANSQYYLIATVEPENVYDNTVTWSSSDSSVATVEQSGVITTVDAGNVTITAETVNGLTASCNIEVYVDQVEPINIWLDTGELTLEVGSMGYLTATVDPDDAYDSSVTWSSSDSSVAFVDQEGVITALAEGTADITAETVNGLTASCSIEVCSNQVEPTSIRLDADELTLEVGCEWYLTAIVEPEEAYDSSVTWSSSDSSVVSVDQEGKITTLTEGTVLIMAETVNGLAIGCTVNVFSVGDEPTSTDPTDVMLDISSKQVVLGVDSLSFTLTATVLPGNVTDSSVTWTSSNSSVATVNGSGTVTVKGEGTATITAKTSNGMTASCEVEVVRPQPASISINKNTLSLIVGDTATLTATVSPSNAEDKSVTWSSSKPSVATVNDSGKVTAIVSGVTLITAETSNGKKATCTVVVNNVAPTSISLNESMLSLEVGASSTLTATVSPSNATNKNVTWTSNNTTVATVSGGKVTAKKAGKATITAKTSNGKTVTCVVTVTGKISASHKDHPSIIEDGVIGESTINVFNGKAVMNWNISGRTDWSVSTSSSWFSVTKTNDVNLHIDIDDGVSSGTRSGKLTIKAGSNSYTITLKQTAEVLLSASHPDHPNIIKNGVIGESTIEVHNGSGVVSFPYSRETHQDVIE